MEIYPKCNTEWRLDIDSQPVRNNYMTILYAMTPKNAKVRASSTRNRVTHSDSTQTRRLGNSKSCDADKYYREISRFQRVVRDTMSHIHRTKSLDIINGSDFNSCVTSLEGISEKLRVLHNLTQRSPLEFK